MLTAIGRRTKDTYVQRLYLVLLPTTQTGKLSRPPKSAYHPLEEPHVSLTTADVLSSISFGCYTAADCFCILRAHKLSVHNIQHIRANVSTALAAGFQGSRLKSLKILFPFITHSHINASIRKNIISE